jgi:hypothetical protein
MIFAKFIIRLENSEPEGRCQDWLIAKLSQWNLLANIWDFTLMKQFIIISAGTGGICFHTFRIAVILSDNVQICGMSHLQDHYLQILDSMPIEVCKFVRARTTKQFKETAAYGKWFGRTFFGYRLHLKITDIGMIRNFILAPANEHDIRYSKPLLAEDRGGWTLADKGYRSKTLQQTLWEQRKMYFHTSVRRIDRKDSPLPRQTIRTLTGKRRLIETVAGQLEQRFGIKTTFARDLWHLMNRIIRKILSHTVGLLLNIKMNVEPLKLRLLVN